MDSESPKSYNELQLAIIDKVNIWHLEGTPTAAAVHPYLASLSVFARAETSSNVQGHHLSVWSGKQRISSSQ